jgi:8-oxo-dGTP pyrophosphatase MutT (NUDIX family)
MSAAPDPLASQLARYRPGPAEAADLERVRALAASAADPWSRSSRLHVTASALILHPGSGEVLLRWHKRQQAWLQVGGHGDPGETDPLSIALREAREETGLGDLVPWPDAELRQVVIVSVPAAPGDPAHEHADLRFLLATHAPESVRAESPDAPVRWMPVHEAQELTSEDNLLPLLSQVAILLRPS